MAKVYQVSSRAIIARALAGPESKGRVRGYIIAGVFAVGVWTLLLRWVLG